MPCDHTPQLGPRLLSREGHPLLQIIGCPPPAASSCSLEPTGWSPPKATLPAPRPWWRKRELGAWWQLRLMLANSLPLESWPPGKGGQCQPLRQWLSNQDAGALGAVGSPAAHIPCVLGGHEFAFLWWLKRTSLEAWSGPNLLPTPRRADEAKVGKSPSGLEGVDALVGHEAKSRSPTSQWPF